MHLYVGGKNRCRERSTTSRRHWRCGTTRICCTGWRSLTLDRSGFAGPNIFARIFLLPNTTLGKGNAMQEKQRVADMAVEVLARQAEARAEWTGEPLDEALGAVLETEAGQQLTGLRDGPYRNEETKRWHDELAPKRAKKRREARQEERSRLASLAQRLAQPDAASNVRKGRANDRIIEDIEAHYE